MIDQTARVNGLVKDELKKLAMGRAIGYAVSQTFGPVPTPDGQMSFGPCWLITVTMRNPLVGYTDIAMAVPVPGVAPPDEAFRVVAKKLLGDCQAEHDRALRGETA